MKNILFVTSLLAVALTLGCKPAAEKPSAQTPETTSQQLEKAQTATKEAAQQIRNYTFEQKDEFVTAMQAQLADLNRSLDELSTKIENSSEAVKAEAKPKLAALREKATQLNKQLGEVTGATQTTWNGIKADAENAYSALKEGVKQSRQAISDKIAP